MVGCQGGVSGSSSKLYLIVICSINTVVGDATLTAPCVPLFIAHRTTTFLLVLNRSTAI